MDKSDREDRSSRGTDATFVVRALLKGLKVLGLFDAEHRELTLDEIAERAGLPRMTAYRLIRTLESSSHLVRDPLTNRYHLGPALLATTYLSEGYLPLVTVARPYLERLAAETGESATLAIEVDGVAVSADMVDTARPFRKEVALGRIIGDTASADGKIFAAYKSGPELERILAAPRPQLTPHTIIDPAVLAAELEQVRSDGVALDLEERNVGTCAAAAPVRDQLGEVIAGISLIVPAGRFSPDQRPRLVEAVKTTAASLSAYLGYSRRV